MTKKYIEGNYFIKIKGRGVCSVNLTKQQAKALIELVGVWSELESVNFNN